MLLKYIVDHKDHNTLHMLLQYHVLTENPELARILISLGTTPEKGSSRDAHYEPAF